MSVSLKRVSRDDTGPVPQPSAAKRSRKAAERESPEAVSARIVALSEKIGATKKAKDIRRTAEEGIALVGDHKDLVRSRSGLRRCERHFYYSAALSIYTLKTVARVGKALEYLLKARRLTSPGKMGQVDLLEARLLALRNRPPTDEDLCDTCRAIKVLDGIPDADDHLESRVHRELAALFTKRVTDRHTECRRSEQETQSLDDDDATQIIEDEEATQPLEDVDVQPEVPESGMEKGIPQLIEQLFQKMRRQSGDPALISANRALRLLEHYSSLVQRIPHLQDLERVIRFEAAKVISDKKKAGEYSRALQYLDRVIKLAKQPEQRAQGLLLSATILEDMDLPKAAGQTCGRCKTVAVLKRVPKDVADERRVVVHERLAKLFQDRIQRKHPQCSSATIQTRSVSSLLIHASLPPDSQLE